MNRFFLFVLLIAISSGIYANPTDPNDFEKHFRLLPKPQKIELTSGKEFSHNNLKSLHLEGLTRRPAVDDLLSELPLSPSSGKGVLTLTLRQNTNLPASPEGYVLEI